MKLITFILLVFSINYTIAYSQENSKSPKDSFATVIQNIDKSYSDKKLNAEQYFDSIYAISNSFILSVPSISNKELIDILQFYRKTIWENDKYLPEQIKYYSIFSNHSQLQNRYGEMLYYAEKINELEIKINKNPSIIALTIIADYYNAIWNANSSQELFNSNKDFILSIPDRLLKNEFDIRAIVQISMMLEKFSDAIYKLNDTINAHHIESILYQIDSFANAQYPDLQLELSYIRLSNLLIQLNKSTNAKSKELLTETFQKFEDFLQSENVPDFLKHTANFTLIDNKLIVFLDEKNLDSARYYLSEIEALAHDATNNYTKYMLKKYQSRYLYEMGLYKNSIDTLKEALLLSEDIRKEISNDINNLMYARAQSENQEFELHNSETQRQSTEQKLIYLVGLILIIIPLSIYILNYIRKKHQRKFLQFKLSLARDLHDEASPVLLYAKALSHNIQDAKIKKELDTHLDKTLEMIRSLSHDIKSEKQNSTADLYHHISEILKKINVENSFTSQIINSIENERFLSLYQFSQLKSIINECISNTIKHANFTKITISLAIENKKLLLDYYDDGKGWDEKENNNNGIGLENLKERVEFLNGNLEIENNFPTNYKISISIPLR